MGLLLTPPGIPDCVFPDDIGLGLDQSELFVAILSVYFVPLGTLGLGLDQSPLFVGIIPVYLVPLGILGLGLDQFPLFVGMLPVDLDPPGMGLVLYPLCVGILPVGENFLDSAQLCDIYGRQAVAVVFINSLTSGGRFEQSRTRLLQNSVWKIDESTSFFVSLL
jgi:hypothetical protein